MLSAELIGELCAMLILMFRNIVCLRFNC